MKTRVARSLDLLSEKVELDENYDLPRLAFLVEQGYDLDMKDVMSRKSECPITPEYHVILSFDQSAMISTPFSKSLLENPLYSNQSNHCGTIVSRLVPAYIPRKRSAVQ